MKTPERKARDARWNYADRAEQTEAWSASYDALEITQGYRLVQDYRVWETSRAGWPISGDDLALAKAGRIA